MAGLQGEWAQNLVYFQIGNRREHRKTLSCLAINKFACFINF